MPTKGKAAPLQTLNQLNYACENVKPVFVDIAFAIRTIRQAQGLSMVAFARKIKRNRTWVNKIEHRKGVPIESIELIAKGLEISPAVLVTFATIK